MNEKLHAWVDESMRTTNVDVPVYLLGASIAPSNAYESAAALLRRQAPPRSKLHWRDLGDTGKTKARERSWDCTT